MKREIIFCGGPLDGSRRTLEGEAPITGEPRPVALNEHADQVAYVRAWTRKDNKEVWVPSYMLPTLDFTGRDSNDDTVAETVAGLKDLLERGALDQRGKHYITHTWAVETALELLQGKR